jgi:endoribonuclease Dicer
MLLVIELNSALFDHSIQEHQLHAAITAPSACAEFDYERLELLGDAYLKYLSSIYLFVTNPAQHEGALHSARLRIISNKALFLNAESIGLAPYIQAKQLVPKQWSPPNFTVIPPPPPKTGSAPAVSEDSTGRVAGADNLKTQGDEREEKEHGRTSPGPRSGVDPEPGAHSSVELGDSVVHEGMSVEKGSNDGNIDKGSPPNVTSKPAVEKLPSKKSKKEDQNLQWLGEKVNILIIINGLACSLYPGNRRCRRSHHRRGVRNRRERNSPQRFEGSARRCAEH